MPICASCARPAGGRRLANYLSGACLTGTPIIRPEQTLRERGGDRYAPWNPSFSWSSCIQLPLFDLCKTEQKDESGLPRAAIQQALRRQLMGAAAALGGLAPCRTRRPRSYRRPVASPHIKRGSACSAVRPVPRLAAPCPVPPTPPPAAPQVTIAIRPRVRRAVGGDRRFAPAPGPAREAQPISKGTPPAGPGRELREASLNQRRRFVLVSLPAGSGRTRRYFIAAHFCVEMDQ